MQDPHRTCSALHRCTRCTRAAEIARTEGRPVIDETDMESRTVDRRSRRADRRGVGVLVAQASPTSTSMTSQRGRTVDAA